MLSSYSQLSFICNSLIDDFCLEENTSAFFLSASVNVQTRKWKLLYLFQAKGGVMQAIGPKAPERVGGGGCPLYEPHSSFFRKPRIFRKCCTVTFVALGTTGYCSYCLKHLRILDRNGPFFPLVIHFPILNLPFGKGRGSTENVVFRLLPSG